MPAHRSVLVIYERDMPATWGKFEVGLYSLKPSPHYYRLPFLIPSLHHSTPRFAYRLPANSSNPYLAYRNRNTLTFVFIHQHTYLPYQLIFFRNFFSPHPRQNTFRNHHIRIPHFPNSTFSLTTKNPPSRIDFNLSSPVLPTATHHLPFTSLTDHSR